MSTELTGSTGSNITLELEALVAAQQSLQPWQTALSLPHRSEEQMKCLDVTGKVSTGLVLRSLAFTGTSPQSPPSKKVDKSI